MSQALTRAARRNRHLSIASRIESLEPRTLLSGITGYSVPNSSAPDILFGSTQDNNNTIWAVAADNSLYKISEADGSTTTYTITVPSNIGSAMESITYNPHDGHLYAGFDTGGIAQIDLNGNVTATFTALSNSFAVQGIAAAPDGALWFNVESGTSPITQYIGRLDPSSGSVSLTPLQGVDSPSNSGSTIAFASDGTAWTGATENDSSGITPILYHATFDSATSSIALTRYVAGSNAEFTTLTISPSGDLWFAATPDNINVNGPWGNFVVAPDQLHQVSLTNDTPSLTNGVVNSTEFDVPLGPTGDPASINQVGFDSSGTVWAIQSELGDANATGLVIDNFVVNLDPASGDLSRTSVGNDLVPVTMVINGSTLWAGGEPPLNGGSATTNLIQLDLTQPALAGVDPVISSTSGQAFSGTITTFASSDAGPFSYTVDYGNGQVDTGTLAFDASGVYTISGATTYATAGNYTLAVTVTDSAGDLITLNGEAVVTSPATLTAQGVNLQGEKDEPLAANVVGQSQVIVAQFQGAPASYSATINWGDNTSSTGQIISMGNDQYYVAIPSGSSKTYTATGDFNVSVTITDGTNTATATSIASIVAVPITASQNLVLHPLFGPIFFGTVATFTADPASTPNWFTATITWGDGTTSRGIVIRTSTGAYQVLGVHIYRKKGTFAVNTNLVDTVDSETALATASIKIG